ncbi:hypothetical protein Xen7305DRAFT_00036630 [Xenococcus sp. PCC 7305]|nr:hypothetical protein Xen7305DRAFT_00036630 [Xenococcus sp. PCC 7305]
MIRFAQKVLRYTKNLDQETFINNDPYYDATLRNLELIGEAATHIPQETRKLTTSARQCLAFLDFSFFQYFNFNKCSVRRINKLSIARF